MADEQNNNADAQSSDVATQPSEGTVNTAEGAITPGEGVADANPVTTPAVGLAPKGGDPSNTYEYGVVGNVNTAVPEGAKLVTDPDEAADAGYFGYAAGEANTNGYTLAEAGARNKRLREARRAVVNRSAEDEDGHTADQPKRGRGSRASGNATR